MSKTLVTVVTVVYNLIENERKEQFIRALESVHNQTYSNIEHIVIDGNSTDGTVDLIEKYVNKGWIKYISEPDKGIYDAMNKGANLAQGKYLVFLNSDDYFSGEAGIGKSIEALESFKADYSYSDCRIIDFDGVKSADWHWQNKPDLKNVFTCMPFCHQTLIVKTDLFKNLGMFDLKYKSAADYYFVLNLVFNKCKPIYIPYEFVTFKLGGFSKESESLAESEILEFYQKYYGAISNITPDECKEIHISKIIPIKLLFKLAPFLNKKDRKRFLAFHLKQLLKSSRKKMFRLRLSLRNPYSEIFGIVLIKSEEE